MVLPQLPQLPNFTSSYQANDGRNRPTHHENMAPSRKSRSSGPAPPTKTLVLDNGAYTLKAGFTTSPSPRVVPNCLARDRHRKTYVGSELSQCKDFGEIQFRRPVDKGFIVSWEAQKGIWDAELFAEGAGGGLGCEAAETRLILAEPPGGVPALQANCDQMVFEEFGFASFYRAMGMVVFPTSKTSGVETCCYGS